MDGEVKMINECIDNLEQQIRWIEDIDAHKFPGWKHAVDAMKQVVVLLKAQEPHLLTTDDFENNPNVDHDGFLPAWIEYRRDGDWDEYWEGQPDEWGVCRADRLFYETMRYWTSRPTKEQMEAVKWE